MNLNLFELAWAAGFFDGEGCSVFKTSKYGKKRYHYLRVTVGQKNNKFNVCRFHKAIKVGKVHGPDWNFYSAWVASTFEEVQATMALLWKFLGPTKKRQYKEVLVKYLEYRERITNGEKTP
jgi:hypothetical protein